jgi:hypothetical protein
VASLRIAIEDQANIAAVVHEISRPSPLRTRFDHETTLRVGRYRTPKPCGSIRLQAVDHASAREQISEPLTDAESSLPHVPADLATTEKLSILLRAGLRRHRLAVRRFPGDSSLELRRALGAGRLGDNDFDGYTTRRVFDPVQAQVQRAGGSLLKSLNKAIIRSSLGLLPTVPIG